MQQQTLTRHRRALHRMAETDWHLPRTAAYLKAALSGLPCAVFSPVGDAVCAYFDFGKAETLALRSDMDALPVTEQTGLSFASENAGTMHACGHDGHMAILLTLAELLPTLSPSRNVLLIFEPAEETTGGARPICETGVLEKYHVTRVFGLHLWPELPKNTVASRAGGMMARSCELNVAVEGRSVHLAKWREGADALAAAAEFLLRAYALAENQPCLLRFGKLVSGEARNSVSKSALLQGSLRCFDDGLFTDLWKKLEEISAEMSQKSGCLLTLSRSEGYPPVTNDAGLLAEVRESFSVAEAAQTFITEDFSEYQKRVPGVFFLLGTGGEPLHSPRFTFDESVLQTGLSLLLSVL